MSRRYRLAVVSSHPIPYRVPLYQKLAKQQEIDLKVIYCCDFGVHRKQRDPEFGVEYVWDVPLLEGYTYKFLRNISPKPSAITFFGRINPGIITELLCNRYDAVLVEGYGIMTNVLAWMCAFLNKTKIFYHGDSNPRNVRSLWKTKLKSIVLPLLFKRISAFLAVGTLNAEYYGQYGVPVERIFLTPYAVNNDFFSRYYHELRGKKRELKKKLGVPVKSLVIVYAGKLIPRKRVADLLEAYEKIQGVNASLVVVGDGLEKPHLEAYARDHSLKNVFFTGFKNQTQIPEIYSIADVFVLPSTNEPWGLVINDAMNFGLPIITTANVGAVPDLVEDGVNGLIYPVGDIGKLADHLLKLLKDPPLREEMGERSLDKISRWSYREDVAAILTAIRYARNKGLD